VDAVVHLRRARGKKGRRDVGEGEGGLAMLRMKGLRNVLARRLILRKSPVINHSPFVPRSFVRSFPPSLPRYLQESSFFHGRVKKGKSTRKLE